METATPPVAPSLPISAPPLVAPPTVNGSAAQEIEAEAEDQVGFKVALSFFPLFSLLKQSGYETCFQKLEHPHQNLKSCRICEKQNKMLNY